MSMTTHVETSPVQETDTDLMRTRVTTEDATGKRRVYEIGISPTSMIDGEHIMHGRRVDEDAPDEPGGGGPSDRAYEAAATRFKAAGYEVYGR